MRRQRNLCCTILNVNKLKQESIDQLNYLNKSIKKYDNQPIFVEKMKKIQTDVENLKFVLKDNNVDILPDPSAYDWVIHLGAISSTTETDVEKIITEIDIISDEWEQSNSEIYNNFDESNQHVTYKNFD